jgi:hypothetical protein
MSYFLEDGDGEYLGDLATNAGIVDMSEDNIPDSLKEFLEEGVAEEDLAKKIVKDLKSHSKYGYVSDLLNKAKVFPVIITDGMGPG